jgi:Skp family chaperone for outer membrane proteins
MRRIMFFAATVVFAAASVISVSAQGTAAQPAAGVRVAVINTDAFSDKDGITRYLNAMTKLQAEFRPLETELQQMQTKYQTLGAEIKKLQDTANAGGQLPIGEAAIRAKVDEYETLDRDIKRKSEDAQRRASVRQNAEIVPIMTDIGKAIQEYANQKGYDLVLDLSKLAGTATILAYNPAKTDITKDFITFYNARPATAATAAAPR